MRRFLPGSLLIAAATAAAAIAAPSPSPAPAPPAPPAAARRKPPTDKYPAQAIEPFVEAVLADKAGELDLAIRRYQDANRISEQANTHYNIADVRRRMERWKQAIEGYKKYVELAPDAPDRAEVERLIAQLEQRPGTAVIDGEDPDGVVFVDGRLIGPSPAVLQVADGRHVADRITPTGHVHRTFEVKPATSDHLRMTPSREEPGNVVLSSNLRYSGSWRDNGNEYRLGGRMELPPGRHQTYLLSPRSRVLPARVRRAPPRRAGLRVRRRHRDPARLRLDQGPADQGPVRAMTAKLAVPALAALAALAAPVSSVSADDAAKRKATPDKFAKAAGESFAAAVAADKAGDLKTALGLYQKAYAISPHPSTIYNIADVQRRLLLLAEALKSYETYLALAPSAGDRKDVEAAIDKISKTPGTLLLGTGAASDPNAVDWKSAYVLVDGEVKVKPGTAPQQLRDWGGQVGFVIPVASGVHVVDVVTAITHGHQVCRAPVGGQGFCSVSAKPRVDGRLVVNSSERTLAVRVEPKGKSIVGQRVDVPAGKHRLLVRDRSYECRPIAVEVPSGGDVQLVFLSTPDYELERCRAIDVKQARLTFAP